MARLTRWHAVYWLIALAALLAAALLGYTAPALQADNAVYDFLYRLAPPALQPPQSVIVAFDEDSLAAMGGVNGIRRELARTLVRLAPVRPAAVAVDVTLTDAGLPDQNAELAAALAATKDLVLACEMMPDGSRWQDPAASLAARPAAVGHVSALPDPLDNVSRAIPLERVAGRVRRWALALEAFRLWRDVPGIESSPAEVMTGGLVIRSRWDEGRPMRVAFRPVGQIPRISAVALERDHSLARQAAGKVVFIGVTAQSAGDRIATPLSFGLPMAGVEVHAQAFETLASAAVIEDAPNTLPLLIALLAALAAAAIFTWIDGATAFAAAGLLLALVMLTPYFFFRGMTVLPPAAPLAAAWLASLGCGGWQYFFVRRRLAVSEADKQRYQSAIHFVTHEMRTPLTAIQGSSELMGRYNLPEEKRKQIAGMINAESKRLAQMITTFLSVEKLSAGELELKRTPVDLAELAAACAERAHPLAEKKRMRLALTPPAAPVRVAADRELLEYAVYNLLTNAIKYSPEQSEVAVEVARREGSAELTVRDQGMGMDAEEVKNLFRKFYRTRRAEQSGITGTGIGLSIVDQIVTGHGGRMRVASRPGKGSEFTIVLAADPLH